ncbi:MAG TPA: hypothetical protein VG097_13960 [Gemmata sp.]|nr:hypothetical protein [Gemmata sp.]
MRWKLVIGFGIAGAVAGTSLGQFAVDRAPQTPPITAGIPATFPQQPGASVLPPGFQPVAPTSPGAYTPPVGGVMPAGGISSSAPFTSSITPGLPSRPLTPPPKVEIESALGLDHPWALKPESGAYFILVKSYARPHTPSPEDRGPTARALAEMLAGQIRELHRVQAFLFEYISDERKAEAAAIAAERERGRAFYENLRERRQQAELQGMDFLDPDMRIRFKTVKYNDQIAVLIGGFKTDLDARRALDMVRKWETPKGDILKDGVVVGRKVDDPAHTGNNAKIESGYLNPYLSATVVANPLIPHQPQNQIGANHCDPFIVKLNEGCPYNLFKATKDWTLAVKSFNAPVQIVSSKDTDAPLTQNANAKKFANALQAGAGQAESMAKMLREMKGPTGQPLRLEAFVLHTRNSSIVTIGQFDSPEDPAIVQLHNLLTSFKLNVTEDKTGVKQAPNAPSLFDARMVPIPIPKP